MTDATVKAETRNGVVHIMVVGEVDMANADLVADEIRSAVTNQATAVAVDLADVTYLDSAGLRLLFDLAVRLPTLQITLEILAPPGSASRRVIEMSGLTELTTVVPPPV